MISFYLRAKFFFKDSVKGFPERRRINQALRCITRSKGSNEDRAMQLSSILTFAKAHTNYYQQVKGSSLSDFPVINKRIVQEHYRDFQVKIDEIPGQVGDLHIQRTSGSTGAPFEIPQDTVCRERRIALIKAANERVGFKSFDPLMHLRAIKRHWTFDGDVVWRADLRILYADNGNLDDAKVARLVDSIEKYKIRVIRGYMTTLDTLTRFLCEHRIKLRRKLIFISVGELLSESLRKRVSEQLGCRIISQYGNEECGVFGHSRVNGSGKDIDLYCANCYTEILKLDSDDPADIGEVGRIVVTDYTNHAFPLIRYEVGDLGTVGARLPSGEVTRICNLVGRKTDMILKPNGAFVDLYNSMPNDVCVNDDIAQWQFIQKGRIDYELRLAVRNEGLKNNPKRFETIIKEILGSDAQVNISFVQEIPVMQSGKRKIVINEYTKGG